ncbi:hypothetical protein BT69DRAFT_1293258 [Atractiella rhizophila]|nr:hypothetical protein BT69DRAFT_1293258 [Atractiella rhizophila]
MDAELDLLRFEERTETNNYGPLCRHPHLEIPIPHTQPEDENIDEENDVEPDEAVGLHGEELRERELEFAIEAEVELDAIEASEESEFGNGRKLEGVNLLQESERMDRTASGLLEIQASDVIHVLKVDHNPGPRPQYIPDPPSPLSCEDEWTLRHLRAWLGTVGAKQKAYEDHAANLRACGKEVGSLHRARKLLCRLSRLSPQWFDQCVDTCMAFTGEYADPSFDHCIVCFQPRFTSGKERRTGSRIPGLRVPRRRFAYLSFLPRIRALFENEETARTIGDFGKMLKESVEVVDKAQKQYRDWYDGECLHNLHKSNLKVLDDPRETGFYASSDGASLQLRKAESNAWVFVLTASCYPAKTRYRKEHLFLLCIIPGPHNPKRIATFFHQFFHEITVASLGHWLFDRAKEEWLLWKAWLLGKLGDLHGSTYFSGGTGHIGACGCRFCKLQGQLRAKGIVPHFFPWKTVPWVDDKGNWYLPVNNKRPKQYDPYDEDLLRTPEDYYWALRQLNEAGSEAARKQVYKDTGIKRPSDCSILPTFIDISTFHPLDISHLTLADLVALVFKIWIGSMPAKDPDCEPLLLTQDQQIMIGEMVQNAGSDLPVLLSATAPRNIHEYKNTHYKMNEWWAWVDWYSLPILIHLGVNKEVLNNWDTFIQGFRLAWQHECSEAEVKAMQLYFNEWAIGFERLYVRDVAENIDRTTMNFHSVAHLPLNTRNHGPSILISQLPCERIIGQSKESITQKAKYFENMMQNMIHREQLNIVDILYPSNEYNFGFTSSKTQRERNAKFGLSLVGPKWSSFPYTRVQGEEKEDWVKELITLKDYCTTCGLEIPNDDAEFEEMAAAWTRWGKATLENGDLICSRRQERGNVPLQPQSKWSVKRSVAVVQYYDEVKTPYRSVIQTRFNGAWGIVPLTCIQNIIGIFNIDHDTYILHRHCTNINLTMQPPLDVDIHQDVGEEDETAEPEQEDSDEEVE